ncbi:MAG: hypothetical protein PHU72_01510 [Dethiosulfovibrio sp.]|nr:hypothetical protein [Dethiosulfovibrio sp.]
MKENKLCRGTRIQGYYNWQGELKQSAERGRKNRERLAAEYRKKAPASVAAEGKGESRNTSFNASFYHEGGR